MAALNFPTSQSDIADKIMQEHDSLRHKVHEIHSVLAERDPNSAEIETLLREFLNALLVHFSHEEEEGFFHEVTAKAPRLAASVGRLCAEHRELLHEAEELMRFAQAGSPSMSWWRELSSRCNDFNRRLMRHECEETQLLQQAHRVEIGGCV